MSCQATWAEYNAQLYASTSLPTGGADVAPRCIKPECNRPLLKNGQCVMGHAQGAGESAPALAPLTDALRCLLEEAVQAAVQRTAGAKDWYSVSSTRSLLQQLGSTPLTVPLVTKLLAQAKGMCSAAGPLWYTNYRDLCADPRIQAAVAFCAEPKLAEAAALARENTEDLWKALGHFHEVETLATQWQSAAILTRARQDRQRLLPVGRLEDVARVVAAQINAVAGGTICQGEEVAPVTIFRGTPIRIGTVPPEQMDLYPDEARQILQQELGSAAPSSSWNMDTSFPLSTAAAAEFLWRRIHTLDDAVTALAPQQETLAQAAGQVTPVELARQHALPLYQEAVQLQEAHGESLRAMGAPGEAVLEKIGQAKTQALQSLQSVPPPQLPQALAGLGYEPRVRDLLRYKAVREAIFNPQNEVDLLTHLPQLAPRAIAAVRGCEQVETLLGNNLRGPQNAAEVAMLIQSGEMLQRVAEWVQATQGENTAASDRWWNAVATLVDALSEHAPPTRVPRKCGPDGGYQHGSRLAQARAAQHDLWEWGNDTAKHTTAAVRQWAETARMPLGRYAERPEIVAWLQNLDPAERNRIEATVRYSLNGKTSATVRAVDRIGTDRLYKKGETVRLPVEGQDQEGEVLGCFFLPSAEVATTAMYEDLPVAIYPAVRVRLTTGPIRTVPIDQVEVVKK